jgi:hypothetical protein
MATAVVMEPTAVERQLSPQVDMAVSLAERAKNIVVKSVPDRDEANEIGNELLRREKAIKEAFAPAKESAHRTHKNICELENRALNPILEAKKYLSRQIGSFDADQERLRREEEARLQRLADEQAAAEAKRIADEQAIADAIQLEAEGDKAGAEAVLNNPMPVPVISTPVILERQTPKPLERWTFRITDDSLIPREYLVPDEKAIAKIVSAMKGKTNIPGIQAYPDNGTRFKA